MLRQRKRRARKKGAAAKGPMIGASSIRLGIDIGGSKAVFVMVRLSGGIIGESRIENWTTGDPERDVAALLSAARTLVDALGGNVVGGGVSAPGPLDIPRGCVLHTPNLPGWTRVPLVTLLENEFRGQFVLENDANCAALAEWRFGAGKGRRNMLFLTMSTGVGGGLVLNGELYRGTTFQAGEVGHMPVELGGRRCHCGLSGCLEAYVGGAALAERIREDVAAGHKTQILEIAGGDASAISAHTWTQAIRAGDAYALELREEFLDRLAQGIVTLIAALDPECVVLGTIIAANPDLFLEPLRERVRAGTWKEFHRVSIEPAQLADRLPYWAAVSAALAGVDPEELSPHPKPTRPRRR
jgi:glucokinase